MKKSLLILLILFSGHFLSAQNHSQDSTMERSKNVIVLDATGLLKQFFNFNSASYYQPNYVIGYRRKFGRNAIRFDIGGMIYESSGVQNDSLRGENSQNKLIIGLGYERHKHLTRRWSIYYGGDFIFNHSTSSYISSWSSIDSETMKSINSSLGIAPLFGLVFRINNKMQLATETSYQFLYDKSESSRIYTISTQYNEHSTSSGLESGFIPPTSLIFRIMF